MAEPMRKEEITTSDLVRDAHRQTESLDRERAADAMREPGRNPAGDTTREVRQDTPGDMARDVPRTTGPQPVRETTDRRPPERIEPQDTHAEANRAGHAPGRQDGAPESDDTPLLSEMQTTELRSRWSSIQTGFVDEPRKTVAEADKLVALLMTQLAEGFASERTRLEKQWDRGDDVSTEDLRVALKRYRSFFDRLLKA